MLRQRSWIAAALALALFTVIVPAGVLRAQEGPKPAIAPPTAQAEHGPAQLHPAQRRPKVKRKLEEKRTRFVILPRSSLLPARPALPSTRLTGCASDSILRSFSSPLSGLLRKKLPGYFSGRTAAIQKGIEEARKTSEDARRRLTDVEGRLSRLDAEIAAMRVKLKKTPKPKSSASWLREKKNAGGSWPRPSRKLRWRQTPRVGS